MVPESGTPRQRLKKDVEKEEEELDDWDHVWRRVSRINLVFVVVGIVLALTVLVMVFVLDQTGLVVHPLMTVTIQARNRLRFYSVVRESGSYLMINVLLLMIVLVGVMVQSLNALDLTRGPGHDSSWGYGASLTSHTHVHSLMVYGLVTSLLVVVPSLSAGALLIDQLLISVFLVLLGVWLFAMAVFIGYYMRDGLRGHGELGRVLLTGARWIMFVLGFGSFYAPWILILRHHALAEGYPGGGAAVITGPLLVQPIICVTLQSMYLVPVILLMLYPRPSPLFVEGYYAGYFYVLMIVSIALFFHAGLITQIYEAWSAVARFFV